MRILTLSVLIASLGRPEIVDRVAVRVGNAVIAESDILREIRLAAFLNGEPPDFGPGARRQTAERLVDQRLIRKEIETGRYPEPEPSGVEAVLKEALTSRRDLSAYRISEDDLKAHLTWQLTALRFIGLRFRTGVQIGDDEIERYFREKLAPKLEPGAAVGPYRAQIERVLIEERANQQAELWLKETRQRTAIEFLPNVFPPEARP